MKSSTARSIRPNRSRGHWRAGSIADLKAIGEQTNSNSARRVDFEQEPMQPLMLPQGCSYAKEVLYDPKSLEDKRKGV